MNTQIEELYKYYLKYPVVITDSRKIVKDAIFFALKGENFDGNKFAIQAITKGCSLAVVDNPKYKNEKHCFYVKNVLSALQELAKLHRAQLKIPLIGITGSNGKTTTKELMYNVLSKKYNCFATEGNLNNHIGVPLSILSIRKKHQMAIIEMGANHIGEIKQLCEIAQPNYGIITNIGKAHLEGFGSYEGVIEAKSELYQYIRQNNAVVFVNSDNELLVKLSKGMRSYTYGFTQADCVFNNFSTSPFLKLNWQNEVVTSQLIGKYNAENIMAACCIGSFFKVDLTNVLQAIEGYTPKNKRSEIIKTDRNNIILDAYNANPTSMKQAIENFKEMNYKHAVLILGDMFELGNFSLEEHQNIVKLISELGFEKVILTGNNFVKACDNEKFHVFKSLSSLEKYLRSEPISGKDILVKGSRGMKLETLLPLL